MSREEILSSVRSRLGVRADDTARIEAVARRLERHARNTVPVRAQGEGEELVERFCEMLGRVQGTTERLTTLAEVPAAVAAITGQRTLCLSPELASLQLAWTSDTTEWVPRSSFDVCVTGCLGAVAETGTVVVGSSNITPLTQNLLGDTHVVILYRHQLVAGYEAMWDRIRAAGIPRHVTFISGPSCTGDIEMVLEYGAHGPRELHVMIVDEDVGARS